MPDTLPDILEPNLRGIFCGINPGLSAAESGHPFLNRSNRFWRVLHLSGFTPHQIDPQNGRTILRYGYGLTTAVARPTRRAAELSRDEFVAARTALEAKVRHFAPHAIAFLGKRAYAEIVVPKEIRWGCSRRPLPERKPGCCQIRAG